MVEVWAAIAGALAGVGALSIKSAGRDSQQGRDSLVRLTSAVDNLSSQLDLLRREQTTLHAELFGRLSDVERSVARLEGIQDRN